MQEFWAQTKSFVLAIAVHALMAALVVLGTINWKPFKPPTLTGMTIEAVMVAGRPDDAAAATSVSQAVRYVMWPPMQKPIVPTLPVQPGTARTWPPGTIG